MMATLMFSSLVLGVAFCAPPGVITAEAIRRGFARGFGAALLVELGSLIGDATWGIIALIGAAFLVQNFIVRLILGILGALFLCYLAWGAFRDAKKGAAPQTKGGMGHGDFVTGVLLSLGNPFAIAFWLSVGSTAVATKVSNPQMIHFVVFFISFMFGAFVWCFLMAGLIAWGRRYITPTFFRWVNVLCGMCLGYFGLQLLWNTLFKI